MAFLNYFLQFKTVADKNPSNSPNLTSMDWVRDIQGVSVDNQASQVLKIPASGSVTIFSSAAKKFIYVEANADLNVTINGAAAPLVLKKVVIGTSSQPGSLLMNGAFTDLVLANPSSTDPVTVFVAHAE